MQTKNAIGNLVNRYRSVLKKCNLLNTFGSLAVAGMLTMGAGFCGAVASSTVESAINFATNSAFINVAQAAEITTGTDTFVKGESYTTDKAGVTAEITTLPGKTESIKDLTIGNTDNTGAVSVTIGNGTSGAENVAGLNIDGAVNIVGASGNESTLTINANAATKVTGNTNIGKFGTLVLTNTDTADEAAYYEGNITINGGTLTDSGTSSTGNFGQVAGTVTLNTGAITANDGLQMNNLEMNGGTVSVGGGIQILKKLVYTGGEFVQGTSVSGNPPTTGLSNRLILNSVDLKKALTLKITDTIIGGNVTGEALTISGTGNSLWLGNYGTADKIIITDSGTIGGWTSSKYTIKDLTVTNGTVQATIGNTLTITNLNDTANANYIIGGVTQNLPTGGTLNINNDSIDIKGKYIISQDGKLNFNNASFTWAGDMFEDSANGTANAGKITFASSEAEFKAKNLTLTGAGNNIAINATNGNIIAQNLTLGNDSATSGVTLGGVDPTTNLTVAATHSLNLANGNTDLTLKDNVKLAFSTEGNATNAGTINAKNITVEEGSKFEVFAGSWSGLDKLVIASGAEARIDADSEGISHLKIASLDATGTGIATGGGANGAVIINALGTLEITGTTAGSIKTDTNSLVVNAGTLIVNQNAVFTDTTTLVTGVGQANILNNGTLKIIASDSAKGLTEAELKAMLTAFDSDNSGALVATNALSLSADNVLVSGAGSDIDVTKLDSNIKYDFTDGSIVGTASNNSGIVNLGDGAGAVGGSNASFVANQITGTGTTATLAGSVTLKGAGDNITGIDTPNKH